MTFDLSDPYFREYEDRGIMKWRGLFLSEHTAELDKKEKADEEVLRLTQQSREEIEHYLERSLKHNKLLSIQLNTLDDLGRTKPDIIGVFRGFVDLDTLLISDEYISLEDIRHVRMKEFQKWSETNEDPFSEIDFADEDSKEINDSFDAYFNDDFSEEYFRDDLGSNEED